MEALLYSDLTKKTVSETLTGSRFRFPTLTYGEDITIGLRFVKRFQNVVREVTRTVTAVRASIGNVDARPTAGSWGFEIEDGSGDIVSSVAFDVSAADLATAINGISTPSHGLGTATVTSENGSWFVEFANEDLTTYPTSAHVAFEAQDTNSLTPEAFLRHRTLQRNSKWIHELRLVQGPVAFTDQTTVELPDAPTITAVADGGEDTGSLFNEIQALEVPPEFRGTYQIRRGTMRSSLLDITDGVTQIQAAVDELVDDGGIFIVTNPTGSTVHIEFAGDMGGINQDLMTVTVYSEPAGDETFTLNLATAPLAALLQASTEETITLPFEIEADFEDDDDPSITYTRTLLSTEVEIRKELNWEELSAAAVINWLLPPLPDRRIPFDYSAVSNGQLHYSVTGGDGTTAPIAVPHNLDVQDATVVVKEISTGDLMVMGTDFSVDIVNTNSLNVTPLIAPTTNNWRITVLGLEETSYFDSHTHPVGEITGLQALLDDIGTRLSDIENRTGNNPIPTESSDDEGVAASWILPDVFEVFPSRQEIADPGSRIVDLDQKQLARPGGLLAAVHDAAVGVLPTSVPAASSTYIGRVFQNTGLTDISLIGGKRHRTATIEPGGYAACDGRLWYPVARYGDHASGVTFSTDYATDANQLDAVQNELSDGARVQLTTTDTLPDPLAVLTDYYVVNRGTDSIELATTSGGTPITLTDDGTGTHTVTKEVETSYYPTGFERELFRIHVNEKQLRLRKSLELRFALEMAVIKSNTNALWSIVIEVGERTQATTPATPGENLAGITWRGTPLLEQQIVVTPVSSVHRMGLQIDRALVSAVDTLTTSKLLYGASEGGAVSPNDNNFVLRGRLIRFDTEDGESDPLGYTVIKGLAIESGVGATISSVEGTAIIS